MSHIIHLAQGDSHPVIRVTGRHVKRGSDLGFNTAQIVQVRFRCAPKPAHPDEAPGTAVLTGIGSGIVSADGKTIDLQYDPQPADLATLVGEFVFKFEVELVDGNVISFPNTTDWPELHIAPDF